MRGSGTDALTFAHKLRAGHGPWKRVALVANSLRVHGGSIVSAGGGLAAALAHAGLDHDPAHTVDWGLKPALLSAAEAEAREGVGPAMEFAVSLSRAAFGVVTVDYATADGVRTRTGGNAPRATRCRYAPGALPRRPRHRALVTARPGRPTGENP